MNPLTQSKNTTILPVLIALTLACFALSPAARAIDSPPDGGYFGQNTAEGDKALLDLTTGMNNTAIGFSALLSNTTGSNNIAVGVQAGINHTTGSNNVYFGSHGTSSESRTIRIGDPLTHGRTFIAGISGVTVAGGVGVIVDANGQLGTVVSSERFKDGIKPMDKTSEAILALKPVTFRYKHEVDPDGIRQFGLVAEEVEKVNPDLSGP